MADDSDRFLSRRSFIASAGTAGALALAGCTSNEQGGDGGSDGGSDGLSGAVSIAGSSTVFPLATQMKEEFQAENPDVSISIRSTGSGGGFENFFCVGETDFNNASRPIKGEEQDLCSENDVEPVELKVATDALTVVVNNEADFIDDVTVEELAEIWREGGGSMWSDIRSEWPDEEISRFGPTEASGTFDYFIEAILEEEGYEHTTELQATENDRTIIQGVQQNEFAIGYFGFAYYSNNQDAVKALAVDGVEPSLETAKSGEYTPLSRPLFTYPSTTSLQEKPQVEAFARFFMENSTSTEIVSEAVGYVPNSQEEADEMLGKIDEAVGN